MNTESYFLLIAHCSYRYGTQRGRRGSEPSHRATTEGHTGSSWPMTSPMPTPFHMLATGWMMSRDTLVGEGRERKRERERERERREGESGRGRRGRGRERGKGREERERVGEGGEGEGEGERGREKTRERGRGEGY